MRKFKTFAYAVITLGGMLASPPVQALAQDVGTDAITIDLVAEVAGKTSGSSGGMTFGPEKGLKGSYETDGFYLGGSTMQFNLAGEDGGYISGMLPEGYHYTSVSLNDDATSYAEPNTDILVIYASDSPITLNNYSSLTKVGSVQRGQLTTPVTIPGNYRYVFVKAESFWLDLKSINFAISDGDTPVLEKAETPIIASVDNVVEPGSLITVTFTPGLTCDVTVTVNGETNTEFTKSYTESPVAFAAPGAAGDVLKVEAVAKGDGYTDSEVASESWTLAGDVVVPSGYEDSITVTMASELSGVTSGNTGDMTFGNANGLTGTYSTNGFYMMSSATYMQFNSDGGSGYLKGALPEGYYYTGVKLNDDATTGTAGMDLWQVYASDTEITPDNLADNTDALVGAFTSNNLANVMAISSTANRYVYVRCMSYNLNFKSITFTFAKQGGTGAPAETPIIGSVDEVVEPGSLITVTFLQGESCDVTVSVNDVANTELTKTYTTSPIAFAAPGAAGDVLKVEAVAKGGGYADSEVASQSWTLAGEVVVPPGNEDAITFDMANTGSKAFGPDNGLLGSYATDGFYLKTSSSEMEFDKQNGMGYVRGALPEGYYYTGVSFGESAHTSQSGSIELVKIYASNEEITYDNIYDNEDKYIGTITPANLNDVFAIAGNCRYVYVRCYCYNFDFSAIRFTYAKSEAPVQAAAPVIVCADAAPAPGSEITVTFNEGLSADITVTVNDEINTDLSKTYTESPVTFAAPGNVGDVLKIEAVAMGDGMSDSETAVQTWTLATPVVTVEVTDHINVANLKAQNPGMDVSAESYMDDSNVTPELNYTGESGAEYKLTDVISNGSWYCNHWPWPDPKGEFYVTKNAGYIKGIKFDLDYVPNEFSFLVSDEPITGDNQSSGNVMSVTLQKTNGVIPEWVADGLYKYFYVTVAQERYNDVIVTWSMTAPEITCKAPVISSYDIPVVPGSNIVINSEAGYTTHVNVTVNGDVDAELSKDYTESMIQFKAPGKPGDLLKVEAYCSQEGANDSETVSKEWTLDKPSAATPNVNEYLYEVLIGQQIVITDETEGAVITAQLTQLDTDNPSNNKAYEPVTGTSPLTITVPEDAVLDGMMMLTAYAEAEGYNKSSQMEIYFTVVSDVLSVPTFSLEDGSEVEKGTKVNVSGSNHATAIRYTINGGEEKVSDGTNLEITIDDDMTIVAWCIGDEPWKPSEKVTAKYTVEVITDMMDEIVPTVFTTDEADLNSQEIKTYKGSVNGHEYVYNGGFYHYDNWGVDRNTFYYYPEETILYNTTAFENGIKAVKVGDISNYTAVYVMLSDEPITEITSAMTEWEFTDTEHQVRLRIGGNTEVNGAYDEWVNMSDFINNPLFVKDEDADTEKMTFVPKYMAMYRFGSQSNYVTRLVIEKEGEPMSVDGINAEDGESMLFDVNGIRILDEDNLAPGIYIRKTGKSVGKFVVK